MYTLPRYMMIKDVDNNIINEWGGGGVVTVGKI
jgi:hypothetical protein